MADVKIINANENSYNIKDEQARTDIESIVNSFSYSADEIITPFKWAGGRPIRRKYFIFNGTLEDGSSAILCTLPINTGVVVECTGMAIWLNNKRYPLNTYLPNSQCTYCEYDTTDPQEKVIKFYNHTDNYLFSLVGYVDYVVFG